MKQLLLFTELFPYGLNSEQAFIQNEIKHLCNKFDKVIVFPSLITGEQTSFGNYNVNISLSNALTKKRKWEYFLISISNKFLYKDLIAKKITFWNLSKIKSLIYFVAKTQIVINWFKDYIKTLPKDDTTVIYTFWNNEITLALASITRTNKNFRVISRAHGHDIYENYYGYNYLPCYFYNLKLLDRLYLVSQPPLDYLSKKYPFAKHKLKKHYLGVNKARQLTQASSDNIIRIVSCSYIIEEKRVDLILKGILMYIEKYKGLVEWTHFGSGRGSGMLNLQKEAIKYKNEYLTYTFKGFCINTEILKFYEKNPIDIFITTTMVEGGVPVSIQEAQAHGIPVIGTNVGGIPEIINEKVGVLISTNPKTTEIADAINYISSDKDRFAIMKNNSFFNWEENFNADKNFSLFASEIIRLIEDNVS
jgi:colanic acid/amylovoran biosynthesis glycosyltransferase